MELLSCPACHGFVPQHQRVCPHCSAAVHVGRWQQIGRALLRIAGGGAMAVTLMACYGGPSYPDACVDYDGDGYFPGCYAPDGVTCDGTDPLCDCNDQLPGVHPENGDVFGDGIDSDCDGVDGKIDPEPDASWLPDARAVPDASGEPDAPIFVDDAGTD